MYKYEAKQFDLPELDGISKQTINEHLKLYEGYIKNLNHIMDLIQNSENHDTYAVKEAHRRLGFEFGGMRNHEYYFESLSGGANELAQDSALWQKINDTFGTFDNWLRIFKGVLAKQRSVGWAMLGYDKSTDTLINYWVDEQHLGHLPTVQPIVALDMWEHSYCLDYAPSEKSDYVDAFFDNLNWNKPAKWFEEAQR